MWEKREAQWEKEAKAREQLMHEVSASGVSQSATTAQWVFERVTKPPLSPRSGAQGEEEAAEAEDAEEPRGSGGVAEGTGGADPAPGAAEGGQAPPEGARGAARCFADAGGERLG